MLSLQIPTKLEQIYRTLATLKSILKFFLANCFHDFGTLTAWFSSNYTQATSINSTTLITKWHHEVAALHTMTKLYKLLPKKQRDVSNLGVFAFGFRCKA